MKKLEICIRDAYYKNEENFKRRLRTIFHEGEYSMNERTKVNVYGYFDEEECRPYIQFQIETDEVSYSSEFHRYDYSVKNDVTVDEIDVYKKEVLIAKALILHAEDLV